MKYLRLFLLPIVILAFSCQSDKEVYSINNYIDLENQDSLIADIITYIYKKPKGVKGEERFDAKYRPYYTNLIPEFQFDRYYISEDGTHYYFIIRPARNVNNFNRGTGGKFKLSEDGTIAAFEELFVTPMIPDEEILTKGREMFKEMVANGHAKKYLGNTDYMEFPNERCIYDVSIKDWRYLVD